MSQPSLSGVPQARRLGGVAPVLPPRCAPAPTVPLASKIIAGCGQWPPPSAPPAGGGSWTTRQRRHGASSEGAQKRTSLGATPSGAAQCSVTEQQSGPSASESGGSGST